MKRRWSCSVCGRSGKSKLEARITFHRCEPRRRRGIGDYSGTTVDEARADPLLNGTVALGHPLGNKQFKETNQKRRPL